MDSPGAELRIAPVEGGKQGAQIGDREKGSRLKEFGGIRFRGNDAS